MELALYLDVGTNVVTVLKGIGVVVVILAVLAVIGVLWLMNEV